MSALLYRACVGVLLLDARGRVFVGERAGGEGASLPAGTVG